MIVMKFGGTSVGDAACFRRVHEIIAQSCRERPPVAVVVSAMSTVTDTLLDAARRASAGDTKAVEEKLAYLEQKHLTTVDELFYGKHNTAARKVYSLLCGG